MDFKRLDNTISVLEKINYDFIVSIAKEVIRSFEDYLIDLVTQRIYKKGTRFDGKKLKHLGKPYPVYSSPYEKKKKRLGKYQGHVDLSLSGDFLKKFYLAIYEDGFTVKAIDMDLRFWLLNMYGDTFDGLTEEQLEQFKEKKFYPQFVKKFKEKLK